MRKSIFYLASMAILAIGCQAELEQDNPAGGQSKAMFTAVTESSVDVKTSMNQDAENAKIYNLHWTKGDKVLVSDGSTAAEFIATPGEDPTTAILSTTAQNVPSETAEKYYAVFPSVEGATAGPDEYTVVIPSTQTWEKGEFDMPMVGVGGSDMNISFMNAASILKITPNNLCDSYDKVRVAKIEVTSASADIAGNVAVSYDGESLPQFSTVSAGSKTITLDCGPEGAEFSETFFIAMVPGSYESLTIKVTSNGGGSQTFTLNTPAGKSYERSKYASVGVTIGNLAIYETANCYLVKKAGTYKFPVNVKGNGNNKLILNTHNGENSSDDSSTEVTFSTSSIDVSQIQGIDKMVISQRGKTGNYNLSETLTNVQLDGEYITFTVPENFVPGNVHIGVYPNTDCTQGTCIWSWHIWVNSEVADVDTGVWHKDFGGNVFLLNMSLGSLQTIDELNSYAGLNSGLYYQWGRKDPFPSGSATGEALPDGYALDVDLDNATQRRVKYSKGIAYPKVFYSGVQSGSSGSNRAWFNGSEFFTNEVYANFWGAEPQLDNPLKASNTVVKTMFDPCPPGYQIISAFGLKSIAYDQSSKLNDMIFNEAGYMYHKRYTDLILPYNGCRTPGSKNAYAKAGQMYDAGSKPYYWCASYYNKSGQDGLALQFVTKEVKETSDATETKSLTVAAPAKLSKSVACPVLAQKQ